MHFLTKCRSLRKLKILLRGEYKAGAPIPDVDLSTLVHPSSRIQQLVFDSNVLFKPTIGFLNILGKSTSVQRIKFKDQFYSWYDFFSASSTNPFLEVKGGSIQHNGPIAAYQIGRNRLMADFRKIIHCLSIIRTIYLASDRGILFGPTMPEEIALHIWSLVFHEDILQYSREVIFNELNLKKLIRIASDRSKLGNEPDTVKRLRSLWIEDGIANFILKFDLVS